MEPPAIPGSIRAPAGEAGALVGCAAGIAKGVGGGSARVGGMESTIRVPDSDLVARGCINSEAEDVSSVDAGLFYTVDLASTGMDHEAVAAQVTEQAEPWKVQWVPLADIAGIENPPAPQDGQWEDWTRIALTGI